MERELDPSLLDSVKAGTLERVICDFFQESDARRAEYYRSARTSWLIGTIGLSSVGVLCLWFGWSPWAFALALVPALFVVSAIQAQSEADGFCSAYAAIFSGLTGIGLRQREDGSITFSADLMRDFRRLSAVADGLAAVAAHEKGLELREETVGIRAGPTHSLDDFVGALTKFRRFSPFNANLIRHQKPGATALGSASEWASVGRAVASDALPVVILWPFGPVRFLYDLEDTLPRIDREAAGDPFGVAGYFDPSALDHLINSIRSQHDYLIDVRWASLGFDCSGQAAVLHQINTSRQTQCWRITLNERLSPAEVFVTACHELGHIFCGHLGGCHSRRSSRQLWPDRTRQGAAEKEIEAEAVARSVASRAGLSFVSDGYIAGKLMSGDVEKVDWDLAAAAVARIEKLGDINYSGDS